MQTRPKLFADPVEYRFNSQAEAEATYLIIAWFAVTESAALGIFPILPTLRRGRTEGVAAMQPFFEQGLQHFRDEQRHANLWCQALTKFTECYPEIVERVKLPEWSINIMLKSIGKPHNLRNFAIDCLAFETVMRAFYDVAFPRLSYPPILPIFRTIIRDEAAHTDFGRTYLFKSGQPLSPREQLGMAFRYSRNLAGVLITVRPLLKALHRHQALPYREFTERLSIYVKQTGLVGTERLLPQLLSLIPG